MFWQTHLVLHAWLRTYITVVILLKILANASGHVPKSCTMHLRWHSNRGLDQLMLSRANAWDLQGLSNCSSAARLAVFYRKVTLADDDTEMIVPLKDYNPGTNRKISSHVTATAKSTGINTPNSQLGDAYHPAHFHQVQAYQAHLPADDAV